MNLLDALRLLPDLKAVVVVTTDKVYHNPNPASPSWKAIRSAATIPTAPARRQRRSSRQANRNSFFSGRSVGIATARAGNVIGGGDWAEDRLIPDAVRAWTGGEVQHVRRPRAVRPWQHVLEPLGGYIDLAERLAGAPGAAEA